MVRSQLWDYFTGLSLCILMLNIRIIFCTAVQYGPGNKDLLKEFVHHAVVFPRLSQGHHRITSTETAAGHLGTITLTIESFNVSFTVDLKLNRNLFSSSYIEKHFAEDGRPILTNPTDHYLIHCYYHGNVRNDPYSTAAISTCDGIRGTIVSSLGTYYIEPAKTAVNGLHYLFNSKHMKNRHLTCGHNHTIFSEFPYRKRPTRLKRAAIKSWPYDSNNKTRIVELYVVNDKSQYDHFDKNLSQILKRTKEAVNVVNSLYSMVNIHIALVGIEVWTDKDKIDIVENADVMMNNFLHYRQTHISQPNDNSQLIVGKMLGQSIVGKAPMNTICSFQYSGGVNSDIMPLPGVVGTTIAHELGHNFGLTHDTLNCGCPDEKCIMAASGSSPIPPSKWSECSKQEFEDVFEQGMDYCLKNLPQALSGPALCGNGFLEEGEQCDCGLFEYCNTSCCDPITCKLTENATCATGPCCDLSTCQLKKAATVCRPATNLCDLPETCNGKDEFCPNDYYHADGKPCTIDSGSSYCYKGQCHTHEGQCQLLWGRTGHNGNTKCYMHFNTMGITNGHCGYDWLKKEFTPCKPQDVFCGMLQCTHRNEKLMFWKEALSLAMPESFLTEFDNGKNSRFDCKGAILDVGLDMPDPGMVPDGATCGNNKICVSQHCINISELDIKTCPDCHGHGVCNNMGECHCDTGYAPPDCSRPGNGGSKSGGPTKVNLKNISLIMGLCIFFLIILPLLIVAGYCGYKHRENLKELLILGPAEGYRKRIQSVCGMIPSAGPMAHTPTTQPMPSRPAPRPPVEDHVTDARTGNQDLDGHQPYRPPPPKNGFTGTSRHATSPWTQQPLPSIPSEAGHEMSTIETNCSRPLVADNKPRDRHRQKNQGRETSPKAKPGLNPQAEGKQIEKYTAGHPLAEARTNSTVGKEGKTSKDKPSPPRRMDVKSLSPPHKDVKSPSLPHKDVKPPVTSKPKPIPAKPKINKKPSVSATKPRPNNKPVGLTVKVPNSKHDTDSIC